MNTRTLWLRIGVVGLAFALLAGCGKKAPDAAAALADGKAAIKAADYRRALVQLKNAAQAQPENGETRALLAQAHYALRDLASARKEYDKAYELGYDRDNISLKLAELMQEGGEAKLFVERFSAFQSPNATVQGEMLAQLGRARFTTGDQAGAKRDFEKALTSNPNEKLAKLGLIRIQAAAGDTKGALKATDELIAQSPDYYLAWINKSDLMRGFSDINSAITAMEKAGELKPDDLNIQANLASMYLNVGRTDSADKALERLRAKAPPNLPPLHYLTALRSFQKGNLQAAQESIGIALKLQPDAIPFVLLAATIESAAGNFEQSEKHAQFVLSRSPDKAYARSLLASSYIRAQKGAQALEIIEPLIKDGSKDANVYALAGEAAALMQDLKGAEKYFEQAAKLAPTDPTQKARLALARMGTGESERAIADLEATVKADSPSQYADVLLIMSYLRQKQFDKALTAIDGFEKKQPTNVLVHNLRAAAYLGKRDTAGARTALEKGLASKPDSISIIQNLARLDVLEGKREAAVTRFETYLTKFPSDPQALLSLAQLKEVMKAPATELISLYERALQGNPKAAQPAVSLAGYYVRQGDLNKALNVLRDSSQKNPEDPTILQRYGALQLQQRDGTGAVSTFSRLTKLQPHIAGAWLQLAEGYIISKNDAGAIQALNRALDIKPTPPQAKVMLAQIAHRQGNKVEALRIADELTREQPKAGLGAMLAADFAMADNDWPRAATQFRNALALNPGNGATAARLHNALLRAGQTAEANAFAAKFRQDNPNNAVYLMYSADVELRAGRFAQAAALYRLVTEKDTSNVMALNNLAWSLHEAKSPEALAFAERAYKIAPRAPAVMDTLGNILSIKGEHDRATKLLQDATLNAPQSAEIRLHLAEAYLRAGQKDKAKSEAEAALKIPAAEAILDKIKSFQLTI